MTEYQVLLFYKLLPLTNLDQIKKDQMEICRKLELKGRVLIAEEGINGTLEGSVENTQAYIQWVQTQAEYRDIIFKKSSSNNRSFYKLSVKVRPEIVTLRADIEYKPWELTAKFLSVEELHDWFQSDREFYILDMRNNYEYKIGHFENSLWFPKMDNFRELPALLGDFEWLKEKTVVTCCTGGIRCEKGSGLLLKKGFKDVYQLKDGIVTYMEKYPNQDFKGKLYVFDNRTSIGFQTDSPEHEVVGRCLLCQSVSENIVNFLDEHKVRKHDIICQNCLEQNAVVLD